MRKECLKKFRLITIWTWTSAILVQHSNQLCCSKASLHLSQIKSLRSCHFLLTFFVISLFFWLSFYLFHSFLGLVEKINEFHPLAPRDLVKRGRKMYIHDGMFYHAKDQFYPVVRKLKQPSQLRFSYKNALITCNTLLDDQDVIELPACYNNVIFSNTCTGIEKNYSQKILIPLRLHWTTLQVVVSTICWNCWNYKDPNKWATQP